MRTTAYYMGERGTVLYVIPDEVHETFMDGLADDETGDVESSIGHVYRAGRIVVRTDAEGRSTGLKFDDEESAIRAFTLANDKFAVETEGWN